MKSMNEWSLLMNEWINEIYEQMNEWMNESLTTILIFLTYGILSR